MLDIFKYRCIISIKSQEKRTKTPKKGKIMKSVSELKKEMRVYTFSKKARISSEKNKCHTASIREGGTFDEKGKNLTPFTNVIIWNNGKIEAEYTIVKEKS